MPMILSQDCNTACLLDIFAVLGLAALCLAIASAAFDLFLVGLFSGPAFLSPLVELSSSYVEPSSADYSNS